MGMSIEEHIAQLKKLKSFHNGSYGASINFALDTMRKYQKIRDKISTIYVGYRHGYEVMADVMEILREVEDGNDN